MISDENMPIPFLEGKQIFLRPLLDSDAYGKYPYWLNDPVVCAGNRHAIWPYSSSQALEYIRESQNKRDELILAIVTKADNMHIGNCSLRNINQSVHMAEVAILLGEKEYWGKGIGREAVALLIRHAFNTLNLNRVYFSTPASNIGMCKIGDALGMSREGLRRKAFYKNGKYEDIVEYGLLRDDVDNDGILSK